MCDDNVSDMCDDNASDMSVDITADTALAGWSQLTGDIITPGCAK